MVLETGARIHVITRRLFEEDLRRHFVGEVVAVDGACARVHGYAFFLDPLLNEFVKRANAQSRIIPLADSGLIITILPDNLAVETLRYETKERRLFLTDGGRFRMEINEFGVR